jgi:hypothetical protein
MQYDRAIQKIALCAEGRRKFSQGDPMKVWRIWITLLTAIVAISFAGAASSAPAKQWSITVSPATFSTATNVPVTITIKNETPNGNSNINSLKLMLPTGYTVDTADHQSGTAPVSTSWQGMLDWTSQSGVIAFSNMSPLKPQSSFTMTAYLNVDTSNVGCTGGNWGTSMAWTGSSFSGDTFLLKFSTGTSVSPNNALAFQSVTPVAVGTPVTGSVHATSCGTNAAAVSVTVKMTDSATTVVGTSTNPTNASGIVSFNFPTSAAGTYTLTASATNYPTITTTVTVCGNSLAFNPAPSNIALGTPVSTSIQANSCGTLASGVGVTAKVKDSGGNVVAGPTTVPTDASGLAFFQFTISVIGTYTVEASATNYNNNMSISAPVTVFDGTLHCGQDIEAQFINPPPGIAPGQPGYAQGMRNLYNKDGVKEECTPVLYSFTNTILTDDTVHLAWDTTSQPNAAFMYQVNWRPRPVVSANPNSLNPSPIGWPVMPRPVVAWLNADGSDASIPGTPAYVPGLACLNGQLPTPYGTLAAQVNPGDTTITVTGIAANSTAYSSPPAGAPAIPAFPIPVVIANTVNSAQSTATERMTVTGIAAYVSPTSVDPTYTGTYTITFNVTRGGDVNGGSNPNATHAATYRVMSTPLPIIPNDAPTFPSPYAVKTQAHMCIAEHGFDSFNMISDPNTGFPTAQVVWFTTVYDIGDGYVGLR